MIGVSSSGKSFKALGRYLVEGRSGPAEGRVAWSSSRNLPTDDPQLAATIMRATAAQNVRTSQPVYHLVLSFDPRDAVNRASMERIADRILSELRLSEHQVVIVAHADRQHAHMHLLVNRVHPETGKMWDRWQDYPTIQRVLREEERALGLRSVESSRDDRLDRPKDNVATRARNDDGRTGPDGEPANRAQPRAPSHLGAVRAEFDTLDRIAELARQRYSAEMDLASQRARATQVEAAIARYSRADEAFDRELKAAFRDPAKAKAAFLTAAREFGPSEAERRMRTAPQQFGELRSSERTRVAGLDESSQSPARPSATVAATRGAEVHEATRDLARLVEPAQAKTAGSVLIGVEQLSGIRTTTREQVGEAQQRVRLLRDGERALPNRDEVEHRLGQLLRRLAPAEFERLRLTLSPQRLVLAHRVRQMVRDAILGRDEAQ